MESERRPEHEKNDLDMLLRVKGPEFVRKNAANIVLGVLLVAAIGYFFYQKNRQRTLERNATNQNTAIAYDLAIQLRDLASTSDLSDHTARRRQELATNTFTAADSVLASNADASQKATAQLAKAEAYWSLATLPPKALATTQPIIGFAEQTSAAYLEEARSAYLNIITNYADQKEIAANALLSLAAIEENAMKFDEARNWYDKVTGDASIRPVYHRIAKARAAKLDDLRKPFALAEPTSQPAFLPGSTTQPSIPPTIARPADDIPLPELTPAPAATTPDSTPTTAPATQPS